MANENNLISRLQNMQTYIGDTVAAIVENYDTAHLEKVWEQLKAQLSQIEDQFEGKKAEVFAIATVFLQDKELLNWTKQLTEGAATLCDKAMDAKCVANHIGGRNHRLFDGGHTISGSWQAVHNMPEKDAAIIDWASAYIKDVTTPMGMPYLTLEKDNFDWWAENFAGKIPGVDKQYLYDL